MCVCVRSGLAWSVQRVRRREEPAHATATVRAAAQYALQEVKGAVLNEIVEPADASITVEVCVPEVHDVTDGGDDADVAEE